MTVTGVCVMGYSVGMFVYSRFGVDPFQVFCHGIWLAVRKRGVSVSFGTFYAVLNGILLVLIFLWNRRKIGLGTVINIVLVGYISDFSEWTMKQLFPDAGTAVRMVLLLLAIVIMCFSSALYFTADLGVSTYDAVALTVSQRSRFPFKWCRIISDIACVCIGAALGWSCGIRSMIGIGTIITAFFMGPLVDFFNRKVAEPMRYGKDGRAQA